MEGLQRVSIFERLDGDELDALEKIAKKVKLRGDQAIFFEGDRSDSLYVILTGSAKVFRTSDDGEQKIISTLSAGSFFGELAMLDGQPRSAGVAALEDSELLAIGHREFREFISRNPNVLWKVMEALCERVRRLGADLLDMSFRDVPYRLLRALVQLAGKHGESRLDGLRIGVKLSARDLAGMVGANGERISRLLTKFQDEGLIRTEGDYIIVPDLRSLERSLEYAKDWS
jgi:CRP/FNR family transcriptional regulator, cyclic AMP receptor protein